MYKPLTLDDIKYSQNLKDNFLWNNFFYKGITSAELISDYLYFESKNYFRTSATVKEHGNLYNLLINELPAWQSLPLRNKSLVFTNDFYTAKGFAIPRPSKGLINAKLFYVVPRKESKIIVSPECDLWESFTPFFKGIGVRNQVYSLINFNASFKFLADYYGIIDYDLSLENFNNLIIKICSDKDDLPPMNLSTKCICTKVKETGDDFFNELDNLFSPSYNNFKSTPVEMYSQIEKNKEVWTDGDCLLIKHEDFNKITDLLKIDF